MDSLNEMGLVELKAFNTQTISGGLLLGGWGTAFRILRYALEAGGAYEAGKDIIEGYKSCRN